MRTHTKRHVPSATVVIVAALLSLGFGPATARRGSRGGDARACGIGPLAPRDRATSVERITFARAGGRPLRLDVVVPSGPGPHPLVILVHGGAWRRGHRSYMTGTMHAFAAQGYAAATVDYRLADAPRNVFPGPVSDVRCAARTLRARAGDLGLDPRRFAAVGFSAGAHLGSMLATAAERDDLDDGTCLTEGGSPAIQAAISFYGPYDLRAPLRVGPGADGAIRNFLGVSRTDDPALATLASPITHVDASDPPMMLVHGLRDRVVEVDQTRRMRRALERAGVPVTAVELPNHRHGFGLFPRHRGDDDALACRSLSFLRESLTRARPRRRIARR